MGLPWEEITREVSSETFRSKIVACTKIVWDSLPSEDTRSLKPPCWKHIRINFLPADGSGNTQRAVKALTLTLWEPALDIPHFTIFISRPHGAKRLLEISDLEYSDSEPAKRDVPPGCQSCLDDVATFVKALLARRAKDSMKRGSSPTSHAPGSSSQRKKQDVRSSDIKSQTETLSEKSIIAALHYEHRTFGEDHSFEQGTKVRLVKLGWCQVLECGEKVSRCKHRCFFLRLIFWPVALRYILTDCPF